MVDDYTTWLDVAYVLFVFAAVAAVVFHWLVRVFAPAKWRVVTASVVFAWHASAEYRAWAWWGLRMAWWWVRQTTSYQLVIPRPAPPCATLAPDCADDAPEDEDAAPDCATIAPIPPGDRAALIEALVRAGWSVGQIRATLKGDNGAIGQEVEAARQRLGMPAPRRVVTIANGKQGEIEL
jgi:hypothetical protein